MAAAPDFSSWTSASNVGQISSGMPCDDRSCRVTDASLLVGARTSTQLSRAAGVALAHSCLSFP